MTDLGTLGGGNSFARDVNSFGQVVGSSQTIGGESHATIWNGGTPIDLNTKVAGLGPDWVLAYGYGINDLDQIVGQVINTVTGDGQVFVLTPIAPVPLPETYALMLAGLAVVGAAARRRKTK